MKFQVNLALNHTVYVDNVNMKHMYLNDFSFVNDILKSESSKTKFTNLKFFQDFLLKFKVFHTFGQIPCIFQA